MIRRAGGAPPAARWACGLAVVCAWSRLAAQVPRATIRRGEQGCHARPDDVGMDAQGLRRARDDVPSPWGPGTTVFFTRRWDAGPGQSSCFATKWMQPDGKTLYPVFSGNDCLSLRKAVLQVMRHPPPS